MPSITYFQPDGTHTTLDVDPATSVMRAAVNAGVPGIIGECGGQAMCATCHVYVRPESLSGLPEPSEDEEEMLDCTAAPRHPARSRLGCQIACGEADALAVDVPTDQV
ncbi:2Fe-2S iron-sulfur cluster-binding protein [Sinomonas albida]|uniref:2Fe-2S iron-sulfur cluster-binding protein n=1 Tax=Sinomonas albida TaxID=369942 RepID=UPI0010A830C3|nr:2Fe-2S iron-sulfur cluster-binding protein [Sinomonas albida]